MYSKTIKLNKKAISPVIAWVLLIGITVSLSAIYMVWIRGQIEELGEGTIIEVSKSLDCQNAHLNVRVEECNPINLTIANKGPLKTVKIRVVASTTTSTDNLDFDLEILPQKTKTLNTQITPQNLVKLSVMPILKIDDKLIGCGEQRREVNISKCL